MTPDGGLINGVGALSHEKPQDLIIQPGERYRPFSLVRSKEKFYIQQRYANGSPLKYQWFWTVYCRQTNRQSCLTNISQYGWHRQLVYIHWIVIRFRLAFCLHATGRKFDIRDRSLFMTEVGASQTTYKNIFAAHSTGAKIKTKLIWSVRKFRWHLWKKLRNLIKLPLAINNQSLNFPHPSSKAQFETLKNIPLIIL